jgi:IS5 family transposase
MLRDNYAKDKLFAEILQLLPAMEPELTKVDAYLEDEELFQLIKADLSKRRAKTLETGRNSTPVEVILRMLVVKRLYKCSYEDVERYVCDSLVLRQFCRVYLNRVPDDTTLIRWANLICGKTLEKFNERIAQLALEHKVTTGRKLRTDGTVVESDIHPPSDSRQLADSVRVLERTVKRARQLTQAVEDVVKEKRENVTRIARDMTRKIGDTLRKRTQQAKETGKQLYRQLVDLTRQTVSDASRTLEVLRQQSSKTAKRLSKTLQNFIPLTEKVIDQTRRRVFENQNVPAQEKIVSIFEPHADIICRGKEAHPVEYGHKIWLNEVDGGIVSHYRILDGNPSDEHQWKPSLQAHQATFDHPPEQASADRGLYSTANEKFAHEMGVEHAILPKPGYKSQLRKEHERQDWFVSGRKWHAGVEGRISVLKRAHGLGRCLDHGESGFQHWVGWGIIAGNLAVMGRAPSRLKIFDCQGADKISK